MSVFNFVDGDTLYHKIALLSRKVRNSLPGSGLLDQDKVITFKQQPRSAAHIDYAVRLANAIKIGVIPFNIPEVNQATWMINDSCSLDVEFYQLSREEANKVQTHGKVRKFTKNRGLSGTFCQTNLS